MYYINISIFSNLLYMTSINPDANLIKELEKLSKQELINVIEESNKIIKNAQQNYKKKSIVKKSSIIDLLLCIK